jgi:hypothetical protein
MASSGKLQLNDLIQQATAANPFTVTTESLGAVEGRHATAGHISTLAEEDSRDPSALFESYLRFLWKSGDPEQSPIGAEEAQRLTADDREAVALAYLARYLPGAIDGRPASVVVGEHLKEDVDAFDRTMKPLKATYFTDETKRLFERGWNTSEQIKELLAAINAPIVPEDFLQQLRGEPLEDQVRRLFGEEKEASKKRIEDALHGITNPRTDNFLGVARCEPFPDIFEEQKKKARDVTRELAEEPNDASLGAVLEPMKLHAVANVEPTVQSIASAGLQRINELADFLQSAAADAASHRKAATGQFKVQVWIAVLALVASVVLGVLSLIADADANGEVSRLVESSRAREEALKTELRARQQQEEALVEELRRMRENENRRIDSLRERSRGTRDVSGGNPKPQAERLR